MIRDESALNALLDAVSRFVRERLQPAERAVAESDEIPADIIAEMKAIGLFGLSIPEAYGGLGLTMEEEVFITFEIGRTSPAFRSLFGTTVGVGSQAILSDGTPEQKNYYLPRLASGELVAAFALTEQESGSDAVSLQTSAVLENTHYLINGSKRFITNAPLAGVFIVMARTDHSVRGASGISAFLVEAGEEGLTLGRPERKMGQQGAPVCDVIFENCRVPAANIIGGKAGVGFSTAMKSLDKSRIHIAAVCTGAAQRMLDDALHYAMKRKQFEQPIAEFQLVQAMLADSKAEIYAAQCMTLDAARRRDRNENATAQASCAKMFASEMCGRVADRALQIFGGAGYMVDYNIERFYRDVRLFRIYEGTTQIQQLIIARDMIKKAAKAESISGNIFKID